MSNNSSTTVVTLFPGQGGFDGEALSKAAIRHPEIRAVFEEIDEVSVAETGRALSEIVLHNTPPTLAGLLANEPWVSQLAIYGTDLAVHRVLCGLGLRPDVLMGHSLGEIAALVAAGVYTVSEGARIVCQRVKAVNAVDLRDGYMVAFSADARKTRLLLEIIEDADLAVAVENHDRQTVVSGPAGAMQTLQRVASAAGISTARLDSPAPFHSPLLRPAADGFADAIREITARGPKTPVYSPILGRFYTADDDIPALLAIHLAEPVKFGAAVRDLHANGARYFIECGAIGTLTKATAKALGDSAHTAVAGLPVGAQGMEPALQTLRGAGLVRDAAEVPNASPSGFDRFWADHGADIIDFVRQRFEADHGRSTPPVDVSSTDTASINIGSIDTASTDIAPVEQPPNQDEVARNLREIYAEALEYPVEVFTDEVELEAELGIDSVKQTELLARVSEKYGLPMRKDGFRLTDYDTMGKVVGYTLGRLADREAAYG